jgi:hypothetical protein
VAPELAFTRIIVCRLGSGGSYGGPSDTAAKRPARSEGNGTALEDPLDGESRDQRLSLTGTMFLARRMPVRDLRAWEGRHQMTAALEQNVASLEAPAPALRAGRCRGRGSYSGHHLGCWRVFDHDVQEQQSHAPIRLSTYGHGQGEL